MPEQGPPKKAFISYSWTSEAHVDWVVALAERLQGDGVEVILDQWDLKEGQDKYAFMESMVTDPTVDKVLAICDRKYAEKADKRHGGVGTESQIICKRSPEPVLCGLIAWEADQPVRLLESAHASVCRSRVGNPLASSAAAAA